MKRFSFYGFLRITLWCISIAACTLIFFLNFLYNASVSYDAREKVTIEAFRHEAHIVLLLAVALILLLVVSKKYLRHIHPQILVVTFSILYTGMALYLILNVDHTIRADAGTVFSIAKRLSDGDVSPFFKRGYIERYPQQTGLLFYDSVLQLFTKGTWICFAANFCFVIGINYIILKIAMLLKKSRGVALLTIILSFAFLPQLLFVLFAYGLIPGFFFMCFAFYHAIRFTHFHRVHNAVSAIIGASLAACLKQNFLIGVIAIAIYWCLDALRSRKKELLKALIAISALLLCFSLPSQLIKLYYEHKTGGDLDGGTPAVLWIAMGTDMSNTYRGPGWYSGYNYSTYTNSVWDTELAAQQGTEKLIDNFKKMGGNPQRAIRFFKNKTISQWCEPMYQSAWSGPLEDCRQKTHTPLLQSIYNGGAAEEAIAFLSKTIVLFVFGFTIVFLLFQRKETYGWELLLLFLIGGLIFHTFWEGKSQYIYPYVFSLIPIAAIGMVWAVNKIKQRRHSKGDVPFKTPMEQSDEGGTQE